MKKKKGGGVRSFDHRGFVAWQMTKAFDLEKSLSSRALLRNALAEGTILNMTVPDKPSIFIDSDCARERSFSSGIYRYGF